MTVVTGQLLRVDDLMMLDEIHHWNPRLKSDSLVTQPNLGENGRSDGMWWRSGRIIQGWCQMLFSGAGSTGGGLTSFLYIDPPVLPDLSLIQGSFLGSYGHKIGSGRIRDNSGGGANSATCSVEFIPFGRNGMTLQLDQDDTQINNNNPFIWASGDALSFNFTYPADERLLA